MEKKSKYLIIMLVAFVICVGVFLYQHNNNVDTVIILNESKVTEGKSFAGMLLDSYGFGLPNKTITYHQPGDQMGNFVKITTNDKGGFVIDNARYSDGDNAYTNFTFAGDGKYKSCVYHGNVTVNASMR